MESLYPYLIYILVQLPLLFRMTGGGGGRQGWCGEWFGGGMGHWRDGSVEVCVEEMKIRLTFQVWQHMLFLLFYGG